jgi:SAM-dependent methyltransferase
MGTYDFGVYHWRRRFRSVLYSLGALFVAGVLWRRGSSCLRSIAIAVALGGVIRGEKVVRRVLFPAPWAIEQYKYDALAVHLPLAHANHILDIGCGTGRSLVGLAPHTDSCRIIGLDVFDDRVILGNAPALAQRNGLNAGIDVTPIAGDAARLPLATDSHDVITVCRVLHDLPATDIEKTLREAHRVCVSDGMLGILELPITPDGVSNDPSEYWRNRVSEAGFDIETVERLQQKQGNGRYIIIVATPGRSEQC